MRAAYVSWHAERAFDFGGIKSTKVALEMGFVEQKETPVVSRALASFLSARWWRVVFDTMTLGVPSASVNYFTASPTPIDPEFVWQFFTRRRPWVIEKILVDSYPLPSQRRRIIRRMMDLSHAAGVEYHYDLSNDFYRLFLDNSFLFYSCADFNSPSETIEQAQLNKANHLLSLIDPKPGERILEFGCGWGSMMRHIHAYTGDKNNLLGYTLSKQQARHIEENFGFKVILEDVTTADLGVANYDKIYSIGAMEHIRPHEILPLLKKLHAALKPGGRLVQHFFSLNGSDRLPTSMIGAQQFFPGSILSLHSDHLAWAQQAGFVLTSDSEHDYRPTLRAWFDRLVVHRDEAIKLVGLRSTNKYLAYFASSWNFFDRKKATLHRLVFEKE
jgi:cyclopropane-fatty-acyl-phospholipid synthase